MLAFYFRDALKIEKKTGEKPDDVMDHNWLISQANTCS